MTQEQGRFVGIGIGSYDTEPPLTHAASDVQELHALLKDGYQGDPLIDPTEAEVRAHMDALLEHRQEGGPLVALWSGHGQPSGGKLRLLARNNRAGRGILVEDFSSWCAESGANQMLIIIDACFAGQGLADATVIASQMLQDQPPPGHVWVGVLVSCSSEETARDGLFGGRLRKLLTEGPTAEQDIPRWSPHNEMIDGEALGVALLRGWDGDVQQPRFLRDGTPMFMLPNPRHRKDAPPQVVEHLLRAARGGEDRSWFTGRTAEVDRVVGWVRSGAPGLHVVTGSPGTGKSAIVGRVVSLSNQAERERLLHEGHPWQHTDPGQDSVQAHVHARNLDANRVADLLSKQLVTAGLIPAPEGPRRDAAELAGHLQRATGPPPVLVVDGLDEAHGEAFNITTTLLTKLAPHCTVIVATREVPRAAGGAPLITELAPLEKLDLDERTSQDSARVAVRGYTEARLATRAMAPAKVCEYLEGKPFLTARVITDQLLASPVDTAQADWLDRVKESIEAAFDTDLAAIPAERREHARQLLTALTWGLGAGLPEAEWITVASALSGLEVQRDHVTAVLRDLGRHLVQDGEEGAAVYRITHQSLADYLRRPFVPTRACVFDPGAATVAGALIGRYRRLITSGVPADVPRYLWKYAWRHCGNAGPDALNGLRELARRTDKLVPDIALAAVATANELTHWGDPVRAIEPLEEAIGHFRELVPDTPMYLADLAYALHRLGQRYVDARELQKAVAPAEEAVLRYRQLVTSTRTAVEGLTHKRLAPRVAQARRRGDNQTYVPHLSGALVDLSNLYTEVGQREEALKCAQEGVELVRELGTGRIHQAPLAKALQCLAMRCSETGKRGQAMACSSEAAGIYRELAKDNPAFLSDLAAVLVGLSEDYTALGMLAEAGETIEEAALLGEQLCEAADSYRPNLAEAMVSLSVASAVVGRTDEAIGAAREAVRLWEAQDLDHPALAGALLNLSRRYRETGCLPDALDTAHQAIAVTTRLAERNAGHLSEVAGALAVLDSVCTELGRPADVDAAWDAALARFHGSNAATLLLMRAASTRPGHEDAAVWLRSALGQAGDNRQLVADLHDVARTHYDAAGTRWPWADDWLTVDRDLLASARAWAHSTSYYAERDYLATHPELLDESADVAVAEALLGVTDGDTMEARRDTARTEGIRSAYHRLLLAMLADEFVDAPPARKRELLAQRRDDLLDRGVENHLRPGGQGHLLLRLAADAPEVLPATFDAMEDETLIPALLRDLAAQPDVLPDVLERVARVLSHPDAVLYQAVALLLAGHEAEATGLMRGAARPRDWIILLTHVAPAHHEVLSLIRTLAEESR